MSNSAILATLQGDALAVATEFLVVFPDAVLTSGGRGVQEQAHAMAGNVVLQRDWILGTPGGNPATYTRSIGTQRLHSWAIAHPAANLEQVFDAFVLILSALSPADRANVSKHFGRAAFDVRPTDDDDERIAWLIGKAAEYGGRFLTHEGTLRRLHWQAR